MELALGSESSLIFQILKQQIFKLTQNSDHQNPTSLIPKIQNLEPTLGSESSLIFQIPKK